MTYAYDVTMPVFSPLFQLSNQLAEFYEILRALRHRTPNEHNDLQFPTMSNNNMADS
jgi:hypothetical protein